MTHLGITGHRPEKLGGHNRMTNQSWPIKYKMEMHFKERNASRIISGMALGTDQWAVELALCMGIKVTALLPCTNQERFWPYLEQRHYRDLLEGIERAGGAVIYVSLQPYFNGCMHRRNQEVVEQSTELLSVWDGTKGGTADCIRLARVAGIPITNLDPRTMEFEKLEQRYANNICGE